MNRKEKVNEIANKLLNNLIEDLGDSSKCGPGLYQVVRGVIQDNKDLLDSLPEEAITSLTQKMAAAAPFRFTSVKTA